MPHERTLTLMLALLMIAPLSLASTAQPPPTVAPAPGSLDPWIDAAGDVMFGDLDMDENAILLAGTPLRASIGDPRLYYGGLEVCVNGTGGCRGPPGATGAQGAPGAQGPAGANGTITAFNCGSTQFLRSVNATGAATCATDQVGTYTAGSGISIATNIVSLASANCATDDVLHWTGTAWKCAEDADTTYAAGAGMELSGTTFSVDTDDIQARLVGSCPTGSFLAGIEEDGDATCALEGAIRAGTSRSDVDTLSTIGTVQEVSLAFGTDGMPVIAYRNTSGGLRVLSCRTLSCSGAEDKAIVAAGVGNISLLVNENGDPRIAYHDLSTGDLRLVLCGQTNCSSFSTFDVDTANADVGGGVSLGLASDVNSGLIGSYYDATSGDLKTFQCNSSCGTGHTVAVRDSTGDVGRTSSVVIDVAGRMNTFYHDATNGHLVGQFCTSSSSCTRRVVASGGMNPSAVIDWEGRPIIAHTDPTSGDLLLTACTTAACDNNDTTTVTVTTANPRAISLSLDRHGVPILAWVLPIQTAVFYKRCSIVVGCGAQNSFSAGNTTVALGLAPDGLPYIVAKAGPGNSGLTIIRPGTSHGFDRHWQRP